MAIVAYSPLCNQKAYNASFSFVDNTQKQEYKAGRAIFYKKNSTPQRKITFSLDFEDSTRLDNGITEFKTFLLWYESTLQGSANTFWFPDLIGKKSAGGSYDVQDYKEYRIIEPLQWSGQKTKEVQITVVEE